MPYVIGTPSRFPDLLLRFCASVRAAGETAEIVVADDGLPPDLDLAAFSPVTRLPCPRPFVFSRNANAILAARPGHDVFLANDDTTLAGSEAPVRLLEATAAQPGIGIVAAAVDGEVGNPAQHASAGGDVHGSEHGLCFVAVYLSRRLIDAVGPLDERFTGYGSEDEDYCRRSRAAGMRDVVDGRVVVAHPRANSSYGRTGGNSRGAIMRAREILEKKWSGGGATR